MLTLNSSNNEIKSYYTVVPHGAKHWRVRCTYPGLQVNYRRAFETASLARKFARELNARMAREAEL